MYLSVYVSISSVHLPSHARLFATPWTAAHQASLSITNSQSLLKFRSIELVVSSNHLILCHLLLLLLSIFPSIRVFSNESAFCIRWPKYWSFSFSISPSNEYSMKHTHTHTHIFKCIKENKIKSVEDVKKMERLYIVLRNVKWCSCC